MSSDSYYSWVKEKCQVYTDTEFQTRISDGWVLLKVEPVDIVDGKNGRLVRKMAWAMGKPKDPSKATASVLPAGQPTSTTQPPVLKETQGDAAANSSSGTKLSKEQTELIGLPWREDAEDEDHFFYNMGWNNPKVSQDLSDWLAHEPDSKWAYNGYTYQKNGLWLNRRLAH